MEINNKIKKGELIERHGVCEYSEMIRTNGKKK